MPLDIKSFSPGSKTCFKKQHSYFKIKRHQRVQQLLPAQGGLWSSLSVPPRHVDVLNRSCVASGLGPGLTALPCAIPKGHKDITLGTS